MLSSSDSEGQIRAISRHFATYRNLNLHCTNLQVTLHIISVRCSFVPQGGGGGKEKNTRKIK